MAGSGKPDDTWVPLSKLLDAKPGQIIDHEGNVWEAYEGDEPGSVRFRRVDENKNGPGSGEPGPVLGG